MKSDPECCCNREVCTYDPDVGCGSRRMFGDNLGRKLSEIIASKEITLSTLTPAERPNVEKTGEGQS